MSTEPGAIAFVYFDLDDTLLDHRRAETCALRETCDAFDAFRGHDADEVCEVYHRHNTALWAAYGAGDIDRATVQYERFARLLAEVGADVAQAPEVGTHYLAAYARHWHLPAAALAAYRRIATRYPVGLLTNGFADVQRAKLERFPALAEAAQNIVISEDVGVMKPHPAIFAYAAAQAGAAAEHILYVGDSLTSDVCGALGAGWQSAWYGGDPQQAPEAFCFDAWKNLERHLSL